MKKVITKLIALPILTVIALFLNGCTSVNIAKMPSEEEKFRDAFSLDISDEDISLTKVFDDRGSIFHDGCFEYKVSFDDAEIAEQMAGWNRLPLDRKADSFLELLSQKGIVLPDIENGRWKFIDTLMLKVL